MSDFRYPRWEDQGDDLWFLRQGDKLVGEIGIRDKGYRWHCKTSDFREAAVPTLEHAKAACEASFWKDAFDRLRLGEEPYA